jgi:hypothetical protein
MNHEGWRARQSINLKSFTFLDCFVGRQRRNNSAVRRNHFPLLAQTSGNAAWLSTPQPQRRAAPAATTGDSQMRTLSFILAFAFLVAGPTMAGLSDSSVPGVGTFTYNGSPIVTSAPAIIVAAR